MRDAIVRKAKESAALKVAFFEENAAAIEACARALSVRLREGARIWVMGNGGSSCDADHLAVEFTHPILEKRRSFPAASLLHGASVTAIANDRDFGCVFEDQLAVLARSEDVAIGISTSGASANVVRGFKRARTLGLMTIGFAGRDGGQLPDLCDHCFVVKTWSIHRIQEVHLTLLHVLWDHVHVALGEDDVL